MAYSFGDCRSIQLSYGRTFEKVIMTIVRFSIAVLGALALLAVQTPAQRAGIAPVEYQARRAALGKSIGPDAVLIAFSSEPARRTGDVDWPFRQEDNLLYLTGMNEPDTTLVLLPGERERREVIFSRDRDPSNERWTGVIPSKEQVTAATGIHEVASVRRFTSFVDALFQGRRKLNGDGSEKDTWHIDFDISQSGLDYTVGDSLGVFPRNELGLVDQIIAMLGASHVMELRGRPLRDVLREQQPGTNPTLYDALLDQYEPGAKSAEVGKVLRDLRAELVPLVKEITSAKKQPQHDIMLRHYPRDAQIVRCAPARWQPASVAARGRHDSLVRWPRRPAPAACADSSESA